jgi:alpha-tubulin suppressor-like RCC1 family protein
MTNPRRMQMATAGAVTGGYELWAWGNNSAGRLGDGTVLNRSSPVQVGAELWPSPVHGVSSHYYSVNGAVDAAGQLWTWGDGNSGGTAQNDEADRSSPTQVGTLTNWAGATLSISSAGSAVKTDGTIWCWGQNNKGQVGDNTVLNRSSPTQVGALTTWVGIGSGSNGVIALKSP